LRVPHENERFRLPMSKKKKDSLNPVDHKMFETIINLSGNF